jgi:ATP-binding cassette, subfamily F, member 3
MSLVTLSDISIQYAGCDVLDNITFTLTRNTCTGLVGENGGGKSTILRLIASTVKPDSGTVSVSRGTRIAFVEQEPVFRTDRTTLEEVISSRDELYRIQEEMRALETCEDDESIVRYAALVAQYSDADGYSFEHEAASALEALGITGNALDQLLSTLSGGERARVALAKGLLSDADLLLLDEPDNHLDIAGITWLGNTLLRLRCAALIVTHDRDLLDRVADSIIEIEDGHVSHEHGSLSEFLRRKRDQIDLQKRQYREQQRRIRGLEQAIDGMERHARGIENRTIHFHYRAKTARIARQAVTMRSRLEREIEREERIDKPREERRAIRLEVSAPKGWKAGTVLSTTGLTKSYDDQVLFSSVNLTLSHGQRIAIVGPNGSGKTTLLNILLGQEEADEGDLWTSSRAHTFYCDQRHSGLCLDTTVFDTIARDTELNRTQIRYLLAKLLFRGDDVEKPVSTLSGGEKTRLVLALLMNTHADLLVLDEPTNHLDVPGTEVLQEALMSFEGALLLVSHDRRLVNAVATDIYELTPTGLKRITKLASI